MAKIPAGLELGQKPTPNPGSATFGYNPGDGGAAGAAILANTGNSLMRTGQQIHAFAEEEKKKADALRAEDAFNTLRQAQLNLTYDEKEGFANKRGADAVNAPIFQNYNKQLDSHIETIAASLQNPEQQALFRRRADVTRLQFGESILRHVQGERGVYQKQVYDGTLKTEARAAGAQWNDPNAVATSLVRVEAAANAQADSMGLPTEGPGSEARKQLVEAAQSQVHASVLGQMLANNKYEDAAAYFKQNKDQIDPATAKSVQKTFEDGAQKQRSTAYRGVFVAARNDLAGLKQLEAAVNKDTILDDTRKTALTAQITSRIDSLERRREAAYERGLRNLERTVDNTQALILKGYEQTEDQLLPLITASKGTPVEGMVRQLVQLNGATARFRLAPPTVQADMRNDIAKRVRANPTDAGVKLLSAFDTIAGNQKKEAKDNPYGFAVNMGLTDPVQVNIMEPDKDVDNLRVQVGVARGVSQQYNVPLKPLTPEQVSQVTENLKKATPKQQLDYFARLKAGMEYDHKAYSAIMGQIAPDNPPVALAGDYANRGRVKPAEEILTGLKILHPDKKEDGSPAGGKLWPMPQGKDKATMATVFTDETSGALKIPEHRSAIEQAAYAIYAARSVKEGDDSGLYNGDRWKQAIKDATGGVQKYNGQKTLMPYGMDYSDFKQGVTQRINEFQAMGQIPPGTPAERLKGLPLDAVGDGKYLFRVGDSFLVGKDGRPLVVDFNLRVAEIGLNAPPTPEELKAAEKPYTGKAKPRKAEK